MQRSLGDNIVTMACLDSCRHLHCGGDKQIHEWAMSDMQQRGERTAYALDE